MNKIEFIANQVTYVDNQGLKNREQAKLQIEFERHILPGVVGVAAYPNDMHWKVTLEPLIDTSNPADSIKTDPSELTL